MKERRLYDTTRWRKARALYLTGHPLCVMCSRAGRDEPANVVDHIIKHEGNVELFWDEKNWMALCASCHSGIKRMQEQHGYSQACDESGSPLDSKHPWNRK